jgi:hypothetical protein
MIKTEDGLERRRAALEDLESALAALKRDVLPLNPARFALMAEPVVDHIHELRAQIDEYIGLTTAVEEIADLWLRLEGPEIVLGDAPTSVMTAHASEKPSTST